MATFDFTKAAGIITTSDQPVLGALGAQFGVPQCMLDFTKEVLQAFPSPILNDMSKGINEGKALADSVFKDVMRSVFLDTGIVEYDTTLGRFVFVSSSSNKGIEQNALQGLNDLQGLGTILGFGAQAVVIGQNIGNQIDSVKNCLDQFKSYSALQKGPSAIADKMVGFTAIDPVTGEEIAFDPPPPALEAASQVYDDNKETLEQAAGFVAGADKQLQSIREIKQARQADPENNPEPVFWNNMPDPNDPSKTLGDALSGLTSFKLIDCETDAQGNPIIPSDDGFNPFVDVINVSGMEPPVSNQGQFLFSRTGIYYDSYGGGLNYSGCITNIVSAIYYDASGNPRAGTGVPPEALKYLHAYNPNIGGKGEIVSWHTFNKWANTAFDLDYINEDPQIQQYYDTDHFLQVLIDNRNRELYDLSAYVGELKSSGYTEDSAVLSNQRQVMFSKIADHDNKIKRRKKQIEVHVLLAPATQPAVLGEIPINNFQNLDAGLIAVEQSKQQNLLFNPAEVSGVVLPLCPEFIKSEVPQDEFTAKDLIVPEVGVGQIITSDPGASGTSGTVLSLTDMISTDGLAAVYNFLDADLVLPDSDKYLSINCATSSTFEAPAQIVASSIDSVFPSGIGVPYFRGVCNFFSGVDGDGNSKASSRTNNTQYLHSAYRPYGYASLQEGFDNIDSLLYRQTGASFDFWTHVPDLANPNDPGWNADSSLSSIHRVILGCENRGGATTGDAAGAPPNSNAVKGLLIGFSRDRRLTKNLPPSNLPADNDLNAGLVFHMSPTQSVNTSAVTFLTASGSSGYCIQDEVPPSGYFGIRVDTSSATTGGHKFNDCSTAFVHTAITIDYGMDQVSIYLNGEELTTASIADTFGTTEATPPNIPSTVDSNSFSYTKSFESYLPPNAPLFPPDALGFRDFWWWEGPTPKVIGGMTALTPWVIGGGYTDGMHVIDFPDAATYLANYAGTTQGMNFMGGEFGGKKSGLHGFIGSMKLYNRALTSVEVLKNYNAQKGFFTNIRTYSY